MPLNSSGSNWIAGGSGNGGLDMLLAPGGEEIPPTVEAGKEFCRGGVPRSGDAKGMVDERRLTGRESENEPVGSRFIGLRLSAMGDSFRDWKLGMGGTICSRHFARSSSNLCVHVTSFAFFCSANSFCAVVMSAAAIWSFCSSFCISCMCSSSLL